MGCSSDLDITPPDFVSDELFYSNPDNIEAGLNGVYDAMQSSSMYGRMPILLDGITDNGLVHFSSVDDFESFGKGEATPNVTNAVEDAYKAPYVVIQRANSLLAAMVNSTGGTFSDEDKANIKAQAQVLRALSYIRLVYLFGDVPLFENALSIEESVQISRTDRNQVVAFIISELTAAAANLETTPMDNVSGRFTKQAALGFLARVMVYEARKGNETWANALSAVNTAISTADQAGHDLFETGDGTDGLANYNGVFSEANEENDELLAYIKYDFALDNGSELHEVFSVTAGKTYMSPHTNLANDFYTTDGLAITDAASIYDSNNPYNNRDPRLESNLVVPGASYSTGSDISIFDGQNTNSNLLTDFAIRKFTTLDNGVELNRGGLDIPILRYAELLLFLAEAENEVNGPTTTAYNAINRVRQRVNVADVTAGLSKDAFRDEVIHERRVELAFEGKRWFDLTTLGIADNVINNINEGLDRSFISNTQELFPIPQIEINVNPNLSQNPGYDF